MQQKFILIIFQTNGNFVIWGEITTAAAGLVNWATRVKSLPVLGSGENLEFVTEKTVITLFSGFKEGKIWKIWEYLFGNI